MEPYAQGKLKSNIAISEPGAGGDPTHMKTRAIKDGDDWIINGRKIWVSGVSRADFLIVMASRRCDIQKREWNIMVIH